MDETNCNDDLRRRIVRGDNERAQELYATIKGKFPSWDKNFHDEEFTYVGSLENGMEVAVLVTSWGASTCRGTTRLLIFKAGKYFGCLNELLPQMNNMTMIKVSGNKIIFPDGGDGGGTIDLSGGIPAERLSDFMPAEQ